MSFVSQAVSAQGTLLRIGDGAEPEVFVTVGEVKTFDGPGGSASVIDATSLQSTSREKRKGLRDGGQVTLTLNRVWGDAGQNLCYAAEADPAPVNFVIEYPNGASDEFAALVMEFRTSGGVDNIIEGSITLEVTGDVDRTDPA